MADTKLNLDLDPQKILEALKQVSDETKLLARHIEEALGKNAAQSVGKLEEAAERGTGRISSYFRNLGQRVREDLRTAFDASGILAGAKFAQEIGNGARQVFEMERAFDRLNTRLRLTTTQLNQFKKQVGEGVAGTGQQLTDVLPGVEAAASRGGITDSGQLTDIAKALGQVRAATGEDVEGLSESVVEILRAQGQRVTGESFRATLDAMQGSRINGAFRSADDAGNAMQQLAPNAQRMGVGTRELGALAATASQAGEGGQNILNQLFERASDVEGQSRLNAILGQDIFQNGKLNAEAIGKVDTNKFGAYSPQILSEATGLQGASGADLVRFIEAFKSNMGNFDAVVRGSNETAVQFDQAADNLASGLDRFRERTKEAARQIGSNLSQLGHSLVQGDLGKAGSAAVETGKSIHENKGVLAAAGLATAAVGVLAGGGINRMLGKIGGVGAGIAKGEAARAMGVQPVYVTNSSEIGEAAKPALPNVTGGLGGSMGGMLGKAGGALQTLAAVGVAAEIGLAVGDALMSIPAFKKMTGAGADLAYDVLNSGADATNLEMTEQNQARRNTQSFNERNGMSLTVEQFQEAVRKGTLQSLKEAGSKPTYTNPSDVKGRGVAR